MSSESSLRSLAGSGRFLLAAFLRSFDTGAAFLFAGWLMAPSSISLDQLPSLGFKTADEGNRVRKLRSEHPFGLSPRCAQVDASGQHITLPLAEFGAQRCDEADMARSQVPGLVLHGP